MKNDYDLNIIIDKPQYTVLSKKDDGKFAGGAVTKDMGNGVSELITP